MPISRLVLIFDKLIMVYFVLNLTLRLSGRQRSAANLPIHLKPLVKPLLDPKYYADICIFLKKEHRHNQLIKSRSRKIHEKM